MRIGKSITISKKGRILLRSKLLRSWDRELEVMNREKKGRPFEFPPSYLMIIHVIFRLPYRQGIFKKTFSARSRSEDNRLYKHIQKQK